MGLEITTDSGEVHRMSMNTLAFFPVATPKEFLELTRAKIAGGDAVKAFKAGNKDIQRFSAHSAANPKTLTPYEGSTYNSINSFYLVNGKNEATPVRWAFIPEKKQEVVLSPGQDFFFENIQSNLKTQGVAWNMVITFANPNDAVENAAIPWEGEHKKVTAAKLSLLSVSTEANGKCDSINFDPLVLSSGFAPSKDPLLEARRVSYAISFGKRSIEKAGK